MPMPQQQESDFDWSKAVPVPASGPSGTATQSAQGPADTEFDWSRAKAPASSLPIAQASTQSAQNPPGAWDRFTTAFENNVGISAPQNATEAVLYHLSGGTSAGLVAYRAAKSVVDSVENAMKSKKPEEFEQAKQDVQRAVTDFHNRDYQSLASSAGSVAGDVISGAGGPMASQVGNRVRSISEGARPGGDLATPLGETAADKGWRQSKRRAIYHPRKQGSNR